MLKRFALGIVAGAAFLVFEGVSLILLVPGLSLTDIPINVGAGAPYIILLAAIGMTTSYCWHRLGIPSIDEGYHLTGTYLNSGTPQDMARRSAAIITGLILLVAWCVIGFYAGGLIFTSVKTLALAIALLIVIQCVCFAALGISASLVMLPLTVFFKKAPRIPGIGPTLAKPKGLLKTLLWLAVIVVFLLCVIFRHILLQLPLAYAIAPVFGLLTIGILTLSPWAKTTRNTIPKWQWGIGAALILLALFVFFLPTRLADTRNIYIEQKSFTSLWMEWVETSLDFDKDEAIGFYGGGDCAPYNAKIGPNRRDIPNNGIDENCSGEDLQVEGSGYFEGVNSHPLPKGVSARPNIILITTDALSQRHTNLGGYRRNVTPNLEAWSKRATVFPHAFSSSTSTRLSFTGIVTGKFNSKVRMTDRRVHPYGYHKSETTIASLLKSAGYRTVHIPGDDYFFRKSWTGYQRGFDEVVKRAYKKAADKIHTAPEVTDAAIEYVNKDADKPLFLWVHYYDQHHPYKTPKGSKKFGAGKSELDHYDAELYFADKHWIRLIRAVENRWKPNEYMIIFTADHGEAFDINHPVTHHDFSIYTEVLNVPLIVQTHAQRGKRFDGLVTQFSILTTIANIVRKKPEKDWLGESLVETLFRGRPTQATSIYSLFYIPELVKKHKSAFRKIGVRTDDFYYFVDLQKRTKNLVKWKKDPLDKRNLVTTYPQKAEILQQLVSKKLEYLKKHERGLTGYVKKK